MVTFLILSLAGFVAGLINAVAGGGMLVVFPALLAVGLPSVVANATSNVGILAGALIGSPTRTANKSAKFRRKYLLLVFLGSAAGALIGAIYSKNTSHTTFRHLAPYFILVSRVIDGHRAVY